jgi:hypothetical protein
MVQRVLGGGVEVLPMKYHEIMYSSTTAHSDEDIPAELKIFGKQGRNRTRICTMTEVQGERVRGKFCKNSGVIKSHVLENRNVGTTVANVKNSRR